MGKQAPPEMAGGYRNRYESFCRAILYYVLKYDIVYAL